MSGISSSPSPEAAFWPLADGSLRGRCSEVWEDAFEDDLGAEPNRNPFFRPPNDLGF